MCQPVSTIHAPQAIGPYSQAIRAGDYLFVSGQIPLDPATGTLVSGSIAPHVHDRHEETVYVIAGEGRMVVGDQEIALAPGALVHVPRGVAHAVEATFPLTALSIFAPPFDGKDRRFLAQGTR